MEIKGITFREIREEDLPFLKKVYRSSREQELNLVPWGESEKAQFVNQQFQAQHQYYQKQFKSASYDVILIHGEKAGRLYLEEREVEFRIIDIVFLPEFRGKGWGTKVLKNIQKMAFEKSKGVGIHVEKNNPAMKWYLRLGFQSQEDKGVYQFMMWVPQTKNNKYE